MQWHPDKFISATIYVLGAEHLLAAPLYFVLDRQSMGNSRSASAIRKSKRLASDRAEKRARLDPSDDDSDQPAPKSQRTLSPTSDNISVLDSTDSEDKELPAKTQKKPTKGTAKKKPPKLPKKTVEPENST